MVYGWQNWVGGLTRSRGRLSRDDLLIETIITDRKWHFLVELNSTKFIQTIIYDQEKISWYDSSRPASLYEQPFRGRLHAWSELARLERVDFIINYIANTAKLYIATLQKILPKNLPKIIHPQLQRLKILILKLLKFILSFISPTYLSFVAIT
jgi:hypothetical protein